MLALLLALALAAPGSAQLDEPLANKALASAVKASGLTYKDEAVESLLIFAGQLEPPLADGWQPEDLEPVALAFDNLLMGLREDASEAVQVLADGASAALAGAAVGPLGGLLPDSFRVGGRTTVDRALGKLATLQHKVFLALAKFGRKLDALLAKSEGVHLVLLVWEPAAPPLLAFDETGAASAYGVELSLDLLLAVREPDPPGTRRVAAAGFAAEGTGDVIVERLDLAGTVVDELVATPVLERWLVIFELAGPGPVLVRVRQGLASVTRTIGVP